MKNLAKILNNKDVTTVEYVKNQINLQEILLADSGISCEKVQNEANTSKNFVIPKATAAAPGIVKGSDSNTPNGVSINNDGTMTITKIEVS